MPLCRRSGHTLGGYKHGKQKPILFFLCASRDRSDRAGVRRPWARGVAVVCGHGVGLSSVRWRRRSLPRHRGDVRQPGTYSGFFLGGDRLDVPGSTVMTDARAREPPQRGRLPEPGLRRSQWLNSECDPGSRFRWWPRRPKPSSWRTAGRRAEARAFTEYRRHPVQQMNGATCFYRPWKIRTRGHDCPRGDAAERGQRRRQVSVAFPGNTAAIKCVHCHDNGPMIRSPYLAQLRDDDEPPPGTKTTQCLGPRFA